MRTLRTRGEASPKSSFADCRVSLVGHYRAEVAGVPWMFARAYEKRSERASAIRKAGPRESPHNFHTHFAVKKHGDSRRLAPAMILLPENETGYKSPGYELPSKPIRIQFRGSPLSAKSADFAPNPRRVVGEGGKGSGSSDDKSRATPFESREAYVKCARDNSPLPESA